MEEEKDKQYYMDLCYRLRSKLKNSEGRKFEQEVYALRRKLKEYDEKKAKEFEMLKSKLKEYQELVKDTKKKEYQELAKDTKQQDKTVYQTNTYQQKQSHELKEKNKNLKIEIDRVSKENSRLKSEMLEIKNKFNTYQDMIKLAINKNKRVLRKDIYELAEHEDKSRVSAFTIMFDIENAFIFQKLFEMHIYDYIVDRQNPENKTEEDTKNLIFICKQFTNNILRNQIYQLNLDIGKFKNTFKHFVSNYIEPKYMGTY